MVGIFFGSSSVDTKVDNTNSKQKTQQFQVNVNHQNMFHSAFYICEITLPETNSSQVAKGFAPSPKGKQSSSSPIHFQVLLLMVRKCNDHHMGLAQNLVNNGINYQPQLVIMAFREGKTLAFWVRLSSWFDRIIHVTSEKSPGNCLF